MLREIFIKNNNDKLIKYSLQLLWCNQLMSKNKITASEHAKIIQNIKREFTQKP